MTAVIVVNEGEYGVACVFNTAYDMSAFTTISLKFTKPDLTTLTVTSPDVTVPNTDLVTVLGTFPANNYAKYFFVDGDLDQTGVWFCRVIYDESTATPPLHLISNESSFTVTP
jgi:hypothetical protein